VLAGGVGTVVRVETVANIAVGEAPWGVFAAEAEAERPGWVSTARREQVSAEVSDLDVARLPGPVVVVGKDVHRHDFARGAVDALRAVRDDVVVIDMGWPSDDRRYADIATFGASRLVGDAVIALVDEAGRVAQASFA
jgi:beta-N-acetylhexosaminidase